METEELHRIARALADPRRFEILEIIARESSGVCDGGGDSGGVSCSDLLDRVPLSQPTVSHHLRELSLANLITTRAEGRYNVATLRADTLDAFLAELQTRLRK